MATTQLQLDETNWVSRIASGARFDATFNWLTKNKLNMDYVNCWIIGAKAGVSLIDASIKLNIKIRPLKRLDYSFKLYKDEMNSLAVFDGWIDN